MEGDRPVTRLRDLLVDLPGPDEAAAAAVHDRAAEILRPSGALAWLDELAEWIAGWHRTERPRIGRPVGLIFAADGVVLPMPISPTTRRSPSRASTASTAMSTMASKRSRDRAAS